MKCNYTKQFILTWFLLLGAARSFAQSDTSSMDSVLIYKSAMQYTGNKIVIDAEFLKISVMPISSGNIMHILSLSPGITRSQEMSSGISVKGANMYASKLLIDGFPTKNIIHNFGFFSALNAAAINKINIYDAYVPPEVNNGAGYLDIELIDPLKARNELKLNVNPYNTSLNAHAKIKNAGVLVSYTKSLLNEYDRGASGLPIANYSDLLIKTSVDINKYNGRLSLYYSRFNEVQSISQSLGILNGLQGRNTQSSFAIKYEDYNSQQKLKHSVRLNYNPNFNITNDVTRFLINDEKQTRFQYEYWMDYKWIKKVGVEAEFNNSRLDDSASQYKINNTLLAPFVCTEFKMGKYKLKTDFRLNNFFINNAQRHILLNRTELSREGKVNGYYLSYNKFTQNYFGVNNNIIPVFQDLQIPVYNINTIPVRQEVNFKWVINKKQSSFQLLTSLAQTTNVAEKQFATISSIDLDQIYFGTGTYMAAGAAYTYRTPRDQFNVNFTLSKNRYSISQLNQGDAYNAPMDRPILFNFIYNRKFKKFAISGQFTAQSGRSFTRPIGYIYNNLLAWSNRNEFRTKPFHHLDIGLTTNERKFGKHVSHNFTFHAYNVYLRQNEYNVIYMSRERELRSLTAFPFLLSLEWNLRIF
jgi:hypothetical protein